MVKNMITKDDLADLATNMITKADLADLATRADLADLATKADLADLATKSDLADMMGVINERHVREEAEKMFGHSFTKQVVIKSLHGVVHIISKAKYGTLKPEAFDERTKAANKLAAVA